MRDLAREADQAGTPLQGLYCGLAKVWFWLGVPAFVSVILILWLMVTKPSV
jgi:uncharacterized membrane protein